MVVRFSRANRLENMSVLSTFTTILSFVAGLFALRELKILIEGDVERYQIVRALSLITMTITPYLMPDPSNSVTGISGARRIFRRGTEMRGIVFNGL